MPVGGVPFGLTVTQVRFSRSRNAVPPGTAVEELLLAPDVDQLSGPVGRPDAYLHGLARPFPGGDVVEERGQPWQLLPLAHLLVQPVRLPEHAPLAVRGDMVGELPAQRGELL